MARNSAIEWTHHTFNPWWGCTKVSEACRNCYAEVWARRIGQHVWGAGAERRFFSDKHWREPLAWHRQATKAKQRRRVFCASMADVFENRAELGPWRERLWPLIESTPSLDWLLLTKRPESVSRMVPWSDEWPANVWLGTTVESQEHVDTRIPALLGNPAAVHFLSCEPLLGLLDLSEYLSQISWVIVGGESGGQARPLDPAWVRTLRDQCQLAEVAFHFKQWGAWYPIDGSSGQTTTSKTRLVVKSGEVMARASKKIAGRLLDGRTWDQTPQPAASAR